MCTSPKAPTGIQPKPKRGVEVLLYGIPAGLLIELEDGRTYEFRYHAGYKGSAVSLALPVSQESFFFKEFPLVFRALLPEEGPIFDLFVSCRKLEKADHMSQLRHIGQDGFGAITIGPLEGVGS